MQLFFWRDLIINVKNALKSINNSSKNLSKSSKYSSNNYPCKVVVSYLLSICSVFPWYPGYETNREKIRWRYGENTELPRWFKALLKRIESVFKELSNDY